MIGGVPGSLDSAGRRRGVEAGGEGQTLLKGAGLPHAGDQSASGSVGLMRQLRAKCVRSALDLIILSAARRSPICGYDVISAVYREFGILLSPGTVYPILDGLEAKGLLVARQVGRRRMYQVGRKAEAIAPLLVSEYARAEAQLTLFCRQGF